MLAVDYSFYEDRFNGTLSEDDYYAASVFAAAYLDEMTGGKCEDASLDDDVQERVKLAFCACVDTYAAYVAQGSGAVASESNDGVSVSYVTDGTGNALQGRLRGSAEMFLATTGLLYRGVYG